MCTAEMFVFTGNTFERKCFWASPAWDGKRQWVLSFIHNQNSSKLDFFRFLGPTAKNRF